MAPRIRTIKPEMFQDEKLSALDPCTRLVFIGLISMADDAGRVPDSLKHIDGFLFPHTDESSREAIETLAKMKRVLRYTAPNGQKCIQLVNWHRHQKVDKPGKNVLPGPTPYQFNQAGKSNESIPAPARRSRVSREDSSRPSNSSIYKGSGSGSGSGSREKSDDATLPRLKG